LERSPFGEVVTPYGVSCLNLFRAVVQGEFSRLVSAGRLDDGGSPQSTENGLNASVFQVQRCEGSFGRPYSMRNWIVCNVILDGSRLHSRRKGEVAKCFGAGGQPFQPPRGLHSESLLSSRVAVETFGLKLCRCVYGNRNTRRLTPGRWRTSVL
jgi:hypothetical protein